MPRIHDGAKKDSEKDRHLQKSGSKDVRGLPKKSGAGKGNWGSVEDERDFEEEDYFEDELNTGASPPNESKIKVVPRQE
ncbi:hypothetical protein HK096_008278 [Nowakowskiella sp. JEL0078]|nr:hypothetical protein HK096_008278 [Nowakowskiella sp. JEL0078]